MGYYNNNNNRNKYIELYNDWLPVFFTASTAVGVLCGLITSVTIDNRSIFPNMIGYASIGVITGITYPVSFPLFGGLLIYKNRR